MPLSRGADGKSEGPRKGRGPFMHLVAPHRWNRAKQPDSSPSGTRQTAARKASGASRQSRRPTHSLATRHLGTTLDAAYGSLCDSVACHQCGAILAIVGNFGPGMPSLRGIRPCRGNGFQDRDATVPDIKGLQRTRAEVDTIDRFSQRHGGSIALIPLSPESERSVPSWDQAPEVVPLEHFPISSSYRAAIQPGASFGIC